MITITQPYDIQAVYGYVILPVKPLSSVASLIDIRGMY